MIEAHTIEEVDIMNQQPENDQVLKSVGNCKRQDRVTNEGLK